MAFQLSPGVLVTEKDLTSIIPAVATSTGGFVGAFAWGPVLQPTLVSSENELVAQFGKPTSGTFASFFSAANFLSYANSLYVVRTVGTGALNAGDSGTGVLVKNEADYDDGVSGSNKFVAKYPGVLGNALSVSIADADSYDAWAFKDYFDSAPGTSTYADNNGGSNDELHIVVVDKTGLITGTPGTILEKFAFVSKGNDARKDDGTANYYRAAINSTSKYVWNTAHPASGTNWGTSVVGTEFDSLAGTDDLTDVATGKPLTGGAAGSAPADAAVEAGWDLLSNPESLDISLMFAGAASPALAKYVVDAAETRKDAVAFVSPATSSGGVITGATADSILTDTIAFRTDASFNVNSSYGVLDSGWKYQYDRYNDVYRWVPLNGDIAGLCARTDLTNDAWWSPGGLNRGQIKNVVKLSFTPNQAQRDQLYKSGINPVVSFPGQGTVLYGDKTLLAKPSAFDRINVRRLFIVLEKAIATAAKFQLFEFNDSFTRAQFRSMVEPFLRNVQGRRGVTDFRVVCDERNNTGDVIDRNEFVADIFVKPNRSINFITLNFVAARSGISFDEIGG